MPPAPAKRLAALQHHDFRLLWSGQLFSTLGKRMQTAIILWHVYDLTGEPLALGAIGLVNVIPIIIISLLAGVLADIMDRRRIMALTHAALALLTGVLAWAALFGTVPIWLVYAVSLLSTGIWTFETPARQALIPNLVPRKLLPNAYSLVSAAFQIGSIVGPALAGVAIARYGIAAAYGLNVIPFAIVVISLMLMRTTGTPALTRDEKPPDLSLEAVREGLAFVLSHPVIRPIMLLDFFATFFSSAIVLLPIFAQEVLMVGPQGYGWLYAAVSIGAVVTAILMSLKRDFRRQGPVLLWAVGIYGAATIVFGLSRSFVLSLLALGLIGAADTLSTIVRQTIRNLQTPDRLRGRMTGLNMMFYRGGPELGELEAGLVAGLWGAPFAVVTGGIGCLVALAVIAWRSSHLRSLSESEPELEPSLAS